MITEDEALRRVHSFSGSQEEAIELAMKLNEELEFGPNGPLVAVNLDPLGWGVMLKRAYETMKTMGVVR